MLNDHQAESRPLMLNFNAAVYEASFGTSAQLPASDVPEIAFSGRSNVGKSTLINKLFNRKNLARISGTPGKTITVNFYRVGYTAPPLKTCSDLRGCFSSAKADDAGGLTPGKEDNAGRRKTDRKDSVDLAEEQYSVRFADLPGYGYAKRPQAEKARFAEMMEDYFTSNRPIKLVVQLIDMRRPPTADDVAMLDFMKQSGVPFIVALTKADKLNKSERESRLSAIDKELEPYKTVYVPFSGLTGEGVEALKQEIEGYVV